MKFENFGKLISSLKRDEVNSIYVSGIIEESTGHFIHTALNVLERPAFVLLENDKRAFDVYLSFKKYNPDCGYFPSIDYNFHNIENLDYSNKKYRLEVISDLLEGKNPVIFSSVSAVNRKIADFDFLRKNILKIDRKIQFEISEISKILVEMGYVRRNIIQAKGEFSIRGDIIDIFQLKDENPVRIELFDTDVDSIRTFDIYTQKSIESLDFVNIYPVNENIICFDDLDLILERIKNNLESAKNILSFADFEKLNDKFNRIIVDLEQKIVLNYDLLLPYIDNNNSSILDYLTKDYLIIFDDISKIYNSYNEIEINLENSIKDAILSNLVLNEHSKIYIKFLDNLYKIKNNEKINFSSLFKRTRFFDFDENLEITTIEQEKFYGKFEEFISYIKLRKKDNYTQVICVSTEEDLISLKKNLKIYDIEANICDKIDEFKELSINICLFKLDFGFVYPKDKISFISYSDIFGYVKKLVKKSKILNQRDLINYTDLEVGDFIVHENYGIGKYLGIKNIEINHVFIDFLEILYNNGDKLFIPTNEMNLVSKFVSSGDKSPKLSKLKSSDWIKTKQKAKKAIEEIAENLLKLYAKRLHMEGFKFSADTDWQRQFEDSFIYEETGAQLRAISEIKADMESSKPMDRLLCGDVGYGKTEVALRAAFKAIMDGKQVVMLAPTTILVKQHFKTMVDRFREFPIEIDFISRFKNAHLKNDVKRKLKTGEIDFIVGTHALLAKDISFKNLGLLIVDEEQRFGVAHKEKIKEMAENIDSLTLSATPIPRTLQMSLSGIRDMSLLDEHPQNRLPINTFVMEFNPWIIKDAISKEINRNGQIYFVYNNIETIYSMRKYLENLVPYARIAVANGRMSTRELENILEDFTNGQYDILLTTTIIETGMDIGNVNTLIIYNADKMGLSQLYQLKGRVGRSDRTSFAYFTYESGKMLTEIAEKRLKAIKDFTELGSGYKIAMRDLELRGAGNMLGESQSGHIESIGYDLYVRMLKESIEEIKGISKPSYIDVKIDLNVDAFIPDKYILEQTEKINIYKKISFIENSDNYYDIIDELIDRFGDMPKSVKNIIDISYIKSMMVKLSISKLSEHDDEIFIEYESLEIFDMQKLEILSKSYIGFLRFDLINRPKIIIKKDPKFLKNLIILLEEILKINGGKNEKN